MTRQLLLLLIVAGVTLAPVKTRAQAAPLTGDWEIAMTTPTGPMTAQAKVEQLGETVTGELQTPLGRAPFRGTFVKDALTVATEVDVQGATIRLSFEGKLVGDTLSGMVKFGDFGEAAWTAKRKIAAGPEAQPIPQPEGKPEGTPGGTSDATRDGHHAP